MTDIITKAVREDNVDSSVKCWHISYAVTSGENVNSFVVVIKAEDMDDATDSAEAKSKANIQAATIKSSWVSSLASATSQEDVSAIEGEVTL